MPFVLKAESAETDDPDIVLTAYLADKVKEVVQLLPISAYEVFRNMGLAFAAVLVLLVE